MRKRTDLNLERQNLRLVKQVYPGLTRVNLTLLRELTRTLRLPSRRARFYTLATDGTSRMPGCFESLHADDASEFVRYYRSDKAIPSPVDGFLRLPCTRPVGRKASSATATLIRRTRLLWSAAPKCVSPKPRAVNRALRKAYGIGLCSVEELGSQPSSVPSSARSKTDPAHRTATALPTASLDCATSSAS